MEEFDWALENAAEGGKEVRTAFAASTGLPSMVVFCDYVENLGDLEEYGILNATTTAELATRLAKQTI